MQAAIQTRTNGKMPQGAPAQRFEAFKPDSDAYSGQGGRAHFLRPVAARGFMEDFAAAAKIAANFQGGARLSKDASKSTVREISIAEFREIAARLASAAKPLGSGGFAATREGREAALKAAARIAGEIRGPVTAEIRKRSHSEGRHSFSSEEVAMWNAACSITAAFRASDSKSG